MICYSSMFYVLILLQDTQSAMPGYCTWGSSLKALQSLGISLSGSCFENPICISDSEDGPSAPSTVSSSSAARGIRMTSCESQSQVESQASQSRESQVDSGIDLASQNQLYEHGSTKSRRLSTTTGAAAGLSRLASARSQLEEQSNQTETAGFPLHRSNTGTGSLSSSSGLGSSEQSTKRPSEHLVSSGGKPMIGDLLTYHKQPDKLYEMSQEDLVQLLRSASAVLGQRTERVEALASANKQLKRRNQQLERDLTTIRETTDASTTGQAIKKIKRMSSLQPSSLELRTRGKTNKRLTADSVLAVGLRRNFSNIASSDFGSTILFPLSHQTVTRCEVRAASALKAAFTAFVLERMHISELLTQETRGASEPMTSYTLMTLAIRSDATNSNIWKRQKLHLCECTVGFSCHIDERTHLVTGLRSMPLQRKRLLSLVFFRGDAWACGVGGCLFVWLSGCFKLQSWFQPELMFLICNVFARFVSNVWIGFNLNLV